jgi:hypothetical protein
MFSTGAGKSALVANCVGRIEEREPESFVFVHFIGSSAKSVSYIRLIRRYVHCVTDCSLSLLNCLPKSTFDLDLILYF